LTINFFGHNRAALTAPHHEAQKL